MKSFVSTFVAGCFAVSALAGELQDAAGRGDVEKVLSLLRANPAAVSARDGGTTALHEATRAGRLDIVKLLVSAGANVNATDMSTLTPLKLALGYHKTDIAEFLRQHGGLEKLAPPAAPAARVAVVTNVVQPPAPLFSTNPAPTVRATVPAVAMANTNAPEPQLAAPPAVTNRPPTEREMLPVMFPIHEAARVGDAEQIKFLFKHSPDLVDATDEKGLTPLHVAAANGRLAAAQVLLSLRAKVNVRAFTGQTPLHVAVRHGDLAMTALLLTNRAAVNARDNLDNTPLLLAVQSAQSETVENQVVLAEKSGVTNWSATLVRQLELASLLISSNAEVNVRNRPGATPLGEAARAGNEPVLNVLLRAGADPNGIESGSGTTPLHLAAGRGYGGIVQSLLRHRATVDAPDARGETPLCYALREGRTNTIALLRQAGGTIGQMRPLSPGEQSLVAYYERTEAVLRLGSSSEKSRALLAMNPTKADLERMFPKHAATAWTVVDDLNKQIKAAFAKPMRDADGNKEVWRLRPEPPAPLTQEWRGRGWLAADLPVFALAVDKTGGTTRPGDFCFVNNHWVLVPPLRTIAAQVAAAPGGGAR